MPCSHLHPQIRVFRTDRLEHARVPHVLSFTQNSYMDRLSGIRGFLEGDEARGLHTMTMDRERNGAVVHIHLSDAATAESMRRLFAPDGPPPLPADDPMSGYR